MISSLSLNVHDKTHVEKVKRWQHIFAMIKVGETLIFVLQKQRSIGVLQIDGSGDSWENMSVESSSLIHGNEKWLSY